MLGLQPEEDAALAAVREFNVAHLRRARAVRRIVLGVIAVFVVAGGANLLGERTARVSAQGGGYELDVIYPSVARPGQDAGWMVRVSHPGGFPGPVRIATDASYLDIFDQTSLRPDPSSGIQDEGRTTWSFDPPAGDTLEVQLEAQIGQEAIGTHRGGTELVGPSGVIARVEYRSLVLP